MSSMNLPSPNASLTIDGAINVRDLGGLRTHDGRRVRRGALIRSAELNGLTVSGVATLAQVLGVGTIVDLRSIHEREKRPLDTRWAGKFDVVSYPYEISGADLERVHALDEITRDDVHAMMLDIYRRLPWELAASIALLFAWIEAGRTPLLFHCAAGKDRTGVAAALLLCALGVERPSIYQDFLMSEQSFLANRTRFAGNRADARLLQPEWEPILRTDSAYLDAMFDALDMRGGIDPYCASILGFDTPRMARLKAAVLEPV